MSYDIDSIDTGASSRFEADIRALYADRDAMPLGIPIAEQIRRLQAASGGAWAVEALAAMLPSGEHLKRASESRYLWAHRICTSIATAIEDSEDHRGGGWPILPRVIGGGSAIVIGGGASALALRADGRIYAMQGTVPDDQWDAHWRRKALVDSHRHGEYVISRHALSAILNIDGSTDRDVEDHSPGKRALGAIELSILPADEGQDRDMVRTIVRYAPGGMYAADWPTAEGSMAVVGACHRAWEHHWGPGDRAEIRRMMRELSGLRPETIDQMMDIWTVGDRSAD